MNSVKYNAYCEFVLANTLIKLTKINECCKKNNAFCEFVCEVG